MEKNRLIRYFSSHTYVHLQDAYFAENTAVGDFSAISYESPTSTVFTYDGTTAGTFKATTIKALDGVSGDWKVVSKNQSGRCQHTPSMPDGGDKLTPNFSNIGRDGST